MKSFRNFLFLTLILTPALSFSADLKRIPAPSVITAVTVYSDRALTTRSATSGELSDRLRISAASGTG